MRPGRRTAVYIVDDDAAVRNSLALLLRSCGYRTEEFETAPAFLAFCPNDGLKGCLLTDLKMPGMNGAEMLEALTVRGLVVPVLAMSAHHDPALERRALRAGATRVLRKPLSDRELIDSIEFVLGRCSPSP